MPDCAGTNAGCLALFCFPRSVYNRERLTTDPALGWKPRRPLHHVAVEDDMQCAPNAIGDTPSLVNQNSAERRYSLVRNGAVHVCREPTWQQLLCAMVGC